MTKVQVRQFDTNARGEIVPTGTSQEVEITPIRPKQFGALTKVINAAIKDLRQNKEFVGTVNNLFGEYGNGMSPRDLFRSDDFNAFTILEAIGFLIEEIPERFAEILSIASTIDKEALLYQDTDTYFEVAEAILDVNDVEKIVKRIKTISSKLGKSLSFVIPNNQEATQPAVAPATK